MPRLRSPMLALAIGDWVNTASAVSGNCRLGCLQRGSVLIPARRIRFSARIEDTTWGLGLPVGALDSRLWTVGGWPALKLSSE